MTLKDKIIKALDNGMTPTEVATKLNTTRSYVYSIKAKFFTDAHRRFEEKQDPAVLYTRPQTNGIDVDLENNKVTMTVPQFEYFLSLWKIAA